MQTSRSSRPTKIAYFLLNLMLVLLLVGAVVAIVSTAVGLARGGNTLLGGHTLPIQAQLLQVLAIHSGRRTSAA